MSFQNLIKLQAHEFKDPQFDTSIHNLFAGVDNISLDKRIFDPSTDDIKHICKFFSIGELLHYEKEKGIVVSHANFFVFVETTQGQYALKFYPKNTSKNIAIEYAVNRLLSNHHFPTPIMFTGLHRQPFFTSNDHLATCYSYVNGLPAFQYIKQKNTICQVNATMFALKNILSTVKERIPFQKQESFLSNINTITKVSSALAPYDQKKIIDTSLQNACRTYQNHQPLFTSQLVHNDITLTNMLIYKKTVYTLDLSHIRLDYCLSDLASLVISCTFFDIPSATIKFIAKNYFIQHKLKPEHFPILNTLVVIGLIREYLKNIQREKSIELSTYPPDLVRTYTSHLSVRKKSITTVLTKIKNIPRYIV